MSLFYRVNRIAWPAMQGLFNRRSWSSVFLGVTCLLAASASSALAQEPAPAAAAAETGQTASTAPGPLAVELNKLEPQGNNCRAYIVITNKDSLAYQTLKLDLILFRPDGVIGKRFAIDLAPLKPAKRTVKLFDIDTPCDQIGSVLINDVLDCKTDHGSADDCLAKIVPSSLAKVQLSK